MLGNVLAASTASFGMTGAAELTEAVGITGETGFVGAMEGVGVTMLGDVCGPGTVKRDSVWLYRLSNGGSGTVGKSGSTG